MELLVTISIATILAGLLLPALCKAKSQTRRAVCASNLRQLGFAVSMFVDEFHRYPLTDEWGEAGLTGSGGKLLPIVARTYGVFICPEKQRAVKTDGGSNAYLLFSYGYNGAGTAREGRDLLLGMGLRRPITDSQIKVPSEMILIGDSGIGTLSSELLNPNELEGINESSIPEQPQLPSQRHRGGANLIFCDGHVAFGKQGIWIEKTAQSRRQWNNDNQPHPETW
jgi:prepilin-type processing-associated H-X9-DG protein